MNSNEISRLELNAHLTKLAQGTWDEEAARTVVRAFAHLKPRSKLVTRRMEAGQRGVFKGHTDEAGDVGIATDRKEIKETITGEDETQRARIGYFKVSRDEDFHGDNGRFSEITMEHFWGADLVTRNPLETPSPTYGVEYCVQTLEPCALFVYEFAQVEATFSWGNFLTMVLSLGSKRIIRRAYTARRTVLYGKSQRTNLF